MVSRRLEGKIVIESRDPINTAQRNVQPFGDVFQGVQINEAEVFLNRMKRFD
jgi:hypothetical protein